MNVVEAYIKFNGQLVIYVAGLSGCGKTQLAEKIRKNFRIHMIKQIDYYKKDYDTKITLPNGTSIINWYTDEAFDWERLNRDIDTVKSEGVVVVGIALSDDRMTIRPNYFILLKIPKKVSIEKRKEYITKHKEKYPEEYKQLDLEKLKMNSLIFPYYLDAVKRSTINKYIGVAEKTPDEIWDEVWDLLIGMLQKFLDEFNKRKYFEWKKKHMDEQLRKTEPKEKSDDTLDVKEIDTVSEDVSEDEYKEEILSDTSDDNDGIDEPSSTIGIPSDDIAVENESTMDIIEPNATDDVVDTTDVIIGDSDIDDAIDDASDDFDNYTDSNDTGDTSDDDIVYDADSDDVMDD